MLPEIIQETASLNYQAYDKNDQDEGVLDFFLYWKLSLVVKYVDFLCLQKHIMLRNSFNIRNKLQLDYELWRSMFVRGKILKIW